MKTPPNKTKPNFEHELINGFTPSTPDVVTYDSSNIGSAVAILNGEIFSDGGKKIIERGFCYGRFPEPDTQCNKIPTGKGLGVFAVKLVDLLPGMVYHVRAYAINETGTYFGNEIMFVTLHEKLLVHTYPCFYIETDRVTLRGEVIADCGIKISERGFCIDINPILNNAETRFEIANGEGEGEFCEEILGLVPGMKYYVRAYMIKENHLIFGEEISFSTLARLPMVLTKKISMIKARSVVAQGIVMLSGGAEILEYGFFYSLKADPGEKDSKIVAEKGEDQFLAKLSNLKPHTRYFIRTYARNKVGIALGNVLDFTTETQQDLVTGIFKDKRDGKEYKTIKIGDQVWMAENLAYIPKNIDSIEDNFSTIKPHYYIYNFFGNELGKAQLTKNYKTYGVLYNWPAAMLEAVPPGWHLPSDEDWKQLELFLGIGLNEIDSRFWRGDRENTGGKLKLTGFELWKAPNLGASNWSHFNLSPGGFFSNQGIYDKLGYIGAFWTSTLDDYNTALIRKVNHSSGAIGRMQGPINNGYSIRCIQN